MYLILTHLAYIANAKKRVISTDNVTVLKAHGKRAPIDVNCYCKLTSVVELDGVTSFLRLKDVTDTYKRKRHSPTIWRDFFRAMAESWKKLKTSNVCSSFIVCYNLNRQNLVRELLSNNSLLSVSCAKINHLYNSTPNSNI